ncbi:MAG: class I SAM-dependent methyltransferase [Desulfobacterales bacterium]
MKLNWAERWAVNNPLRGVQQRLEVYWLSRIMPLEPGASILEVGCGRGVGAKLIWQECLPVRLHIQDLDIEMIRKAKHRHAPSESPGVTLSVGDTTELPFSDATFDAVFGFGVLHHVPDWRRAMHEIRRVLKTGGIYYIEELYPSFYQNFITKYILLHPKEDRFRSIDFRGAFDEAHMPLKEAFELKKVGILGVAVKEE